MPGSQLTSPDIAAQDLAAPSAPPCRTSAPPPPRGAMVAILAVSLLGFVACLLLVLRLSPQTPLLLALPLVFAGGLMLVPVGLSLLRGRAEAYIGFMGLMLFLTVSQFRSRAWNDGSVDWQVMMKGGVWVIAGAIGIWQLQRTAKYLAHPPVMFGALFILFLTMSTLWSPVTGYTALSSLGYICFFLFALAAVDRLDETQLLQGLALGLGALVLLSLAIYPIYGVSFAEVSEGSTGEADRLRGITGHPVSLAQASVQFALVCLLLMGRVRRGKWLFLVMLAAAVVTLLLTQSRMAAVAMTAGFIIAWVHKRGLILYALPIALAVGTALLMVAALAGMQAIMPDNILALFSRSGRATEVVTLTGRVDIWAFVLERISAEPIFGHGHASARLVLLGNFGLWALAHAHNVYLQALLYLGIVGFVLMMLALLFQVLRFLKAPSLMRDTILIYLLILGVTEQAFLSNLPGTETFLWFVVMAMAVPAAKLAGSRSRRAQAA